MKKNIIIILTCLFFLLCINTFAQSDSSSNNLIYKDKEFPFSIGYPKDWKQVEESTPQIKLEVISENGEGTANFNISVNSVKGSENVLPATYVKLFLNDNPELINEIAKKNLRDAKVISSGKTYLSNQDAFFIIFEGNYKVLDETIELKIYLLQMLYEGNVYTLSFGGLKEEFEIYFPTFKAIASSFGVLPIKTVVPQTKKANPKKVRKPNK